MKSTNTIKYVQDKDIGYLTFSRPETKNAINIEMMKDLKKLVSDLNSKKDRLKAIVLNGDNNVFSSGADLFEFYSWKEHPERRNQFLEYGDKFIAFVQSLPFSLAVIQGYAYGGALEIALACDYRIAETSAKFASLEINYGFIPGNGATQRLPELIGKPQAKRMILSGDTINAQQAKEYGLIQEVLDLTGLYARAREIVDAIASKELYALKMAKDAIKGSPESFEKERKYFIECIERPSVQEKIESFFKKSIRAKK